MKMFVDCYGRKATGAGLLQTLGAKYPDEAKTSGDVTYLRYGVGTNCAIHKIDEADGMSRRWAYGQWADRATLTYTAGMQDVIEIDEE